MKQQINLYLHQDVQKVPLSAVSCLLIVFVSLLLLGAVYGYNWQQQNILQVDMAALKNKQSRLQQDYESLRQRMVTPAESPALKKELERINADLASKRRFELVLGQLRSDSKIQFSSVLQGLSEQSIDGLWLTRIQSDTAIRAVILEGRALTPDLVPRYLKGLGQEAAYTRAHFDQLQLQEAERGLSFLVNGELQAGGLE
ncbi:MAG: hypothetical protein V7739_19265 [Motiliproteus sp.]